MSNVISEFLKDIASFHRYKKRFIALTVDTGLCILCTWLAFSLRYEELILFKHIHFYPTLISVLLTLPIFWLFGLYRIIFRYTNLSIIFTIFASTFLYGFIYFLIIGIYRIEGVPRSIGIIQPMLLFFAVSASRLSVKYIIII